MSVDRQTLHLWLHHWQDEGDAAFLYTVLSAQEPDPRKRQIYNKLADVERRHTELWAKLLGETGHAVPAAGPRPSLNARFMAWLGRRFGPGYLLPLLLREEGREVRGYMDLHKTSSGADARAVSLTLAKESAEHAETLAGLAGASAEPWHRSGSGGFVRNVVYGFNDGLTANFGLVAGVIGAAVAPHMILISGVAGMIADALSMGSSGYLAAKSEQEVYAHEIAMEKEEIRLMPDVEEEEIALVYEAKGIESAQARGHVRGGAGGGGGRILRRRPGGEVPVNGRLDDQVDEPVLHVDRFLHRVAVHKLPHAFFGEGARDDLGLGRPARHGDPPAQLAVHLHRDLHLLGGREPLVEGGPTRRGEDRILMAEPLPQRLAEVRRVGGKENEQRLGRAPRRRHRSRLAHQVDVLHHRRDRGVVVQRFGIGADLLDGLVQLALHRRRELPGAGAGGLVRACPHLVEEPPDPDDAGIAEVPALLEGAEEHEVHAERVGSPLLEVLVGDDGVAPRLGHLGPVLHDHPVGAELDIRLLEGEVPEILERHGDEPRVHEV